MKCSENFNLLFKQVTDLANIQCIRKEFTKTLMVSKLDKLTINSINPNTHGYGTKRAFFL
jgi:hypothetical protein